jgi:CheY-like chemotaxis protein
VSTYKILIIDDDLIIRTLLQLCLDSTGRWHVLQAASGAEGAELAAVEIPDVILLDMYLPDLDGRQVLALLRQQAELRSVPVILMTASSQDVIDMVSNVAGIIEKPFDPLTVESEILKLSGKQ